MARIRSVHPGLFTDEAFVSCSPAARVLFIGLWTEADDGGAFEWKPLTIKMRLMSADEGTAAPLLDELAAANMVKRYLVDGREYGVVRNFCRYQRPKKPKFVHPIPSEFRTYVGSSTPSSVPDDDEDTSGGEPGVSEASQVPPKSEPNPRDEPPVPKKSRKSFQREEGGGRMKEVEEEAAQPVYSAASNGEKPPDTGRPDDDFDRAEKACIAALGGQPFEGGQAPGDLVFGPMMLLVDGGTPLNQIVTVLRSERERHRKHPIRTWSMWATIVAERLADQPKTNGKTKPADPDEERIPLEPGRNPRTWPISSVRMVLAAWHKDPSLWMDILGNRPGTPGCIIPQYLIDEVAS